MINEEYLVIYCKELRKQNTGFMARLVIENILKVIRKEQEYEDQQLFCDNDHDSTMKYDKEKHSGYYHVKERFRERELEQ